MVPVREQQLNPGYVSLYRWLTRVGFEGDRAIGAVNSVWNYQSRAVDLVVFGGEAPTLIGAKVEDNSDILIHLRPITHQDITRRAKNRLERRLSGILQTEVSQFHGEILFKVDFADQLGAVEGETHLGVIGLTEGSQKKFGDSLREGAKFSIEHPAASRRVFDLVTGLSDMPEVDKSSAIEEIHAILTLP